MVSHALKHLEMMDKKVKEMKDANNILYINEKEEVEKENEKLYRKMKRVISD